MLRGVGRTRFVRSNGNWQSCDAAPLDGSPRCARLPDATAAAWTGTRLAGQLACKRRCRDDRRWPPHRTSPAPSSKSFQDVVMKCGKRSRATGSGCDVGWAQACPTFASRSTESALQAGWSTATAISTNDRCDPPRRARPPTLGGCCRPCSRASPSAPLPRSPSRGTTSEAVRSPWRLWRRVPPGRCCSRRRGRAVRRGLQLKTRAGGRCSSGPVRARGLTGQTGPHRSMSCDGT